MTRPKNKGAFANTQPSNDSQRKQWFGTINNPLPEFTHQEIMERLKGLKTFQYVAMSDERATTGTMHTHFYVCFGSAVRFSTLKKLFPTANLLFVTGGVEDNINYLKKEGHWQGTDKSHTSIDGSFEELGTPPPETAGKRIEFIELYNMIAFDNLSNAEIIRRNTDYILQIDKLDKLRTTILQDRYRSTRRLELEVTYVTGVTGMGKSRDILDEHGDSNCYRVTEYRHPFDGYTVEPVIVFEEFRNSIPIKDMLNYLDIYPIQLTARYTNKFACYLKVYISTNWPLERQYEYERRNDPETYEAFLRRIHRVKEYTEDGIVEYDSVQAYMKSREEFRNIGSKGKTPFNKQK